MGRAPSAPLCAAFAGKIWIMGGRGENGGQTATHIYEPHSDQWKQGPDIPLLIAGGAYEDERAGGYYNTDRVFLLRQDTLPARS
jgi:hypothetical protein